MRHRPLRTREQARADIERRGISLAEWAREHGVNPKRVYDVISGRNIGKFGESHRIAVLLGLREGDLTEQVKA